MKKIILSAALAIGGFGLFAQGNSEAEIRSMDTPWTNQVDEQPHGEYPRPQMSRENWVNLNGQWDYAIKPKGESVPSSFDGKILVPFAVESKLSGVGKNVGEDNELWYRRSFNVEPEQRKERLLMHFGAVDWEAEVFVNGQSAGTHRGGYDPFYFDITDLLNETSNQEVVVRVWDPSDDGPQPRGKQVKKPNSIWYTPVTGIWQTVWLEQVPNSYIAEIKNTPEFDQNSIKVSTRVEGAKEGFQVAVRLLDEGQEVASRTISANEAEVTLEVSNPKHWSPENPFLYDIEVRLRRGNEEVDRVDSYSALRKISMEADTDGIQRMMLNNEFVFQYGPLDQGWWPDGLYTAPNEKAMLFDIIKTQEMGFNMIRKHVKVEPARWYYHCDKMGMLVWQDMPNGDHGNKWEPRPGITGVGTEKERTSESEEIFRTEWKAIMDANYNFPSIVVWVPFNEAWGQFKTMEITEWTQAYDPTRLVNSASGGNFIMEGTKITGDMIDLHNYPDAAMPEASIFGKDQILVLGEFGGLGLPVEGHTWQDKDNWGYQSFENKEELMERYRKLIDALLPLIRDGLSAAVYTQTTDVEIEVNGLMTYDREIIKLDEHLLKELHQKLYEISIEP
ncbi:beta-galactosidase [Litoribacter alkaliphilus]|uniref:Beta-galactosidase n=1 Tax=Litoribacter ruber TaxID=702568 RepID=A0AAP2CPX4_9BACT|nr:sugar-binding domain-containing protein [Litoribacter alkaliphilus]MBS9525732.1 beta-galactosidase [Litoribacter alkaliphilus]